MKRILLLVSLLVFLLASCSDDETASTQVTVTVDGSARSFKLVSAKYSPVTQTADLVFQNSSVGILDITFMGFTSIEAFEQGNYSSDDCRVIVLLTNNQTQTIAGSDESESTAVVTITESSVSGNSVSIMGEANEIVLYDPFLDETVTLTDFEFKGTIKENETDDFISFEVSGTEYVFPTENLSGYDYHPLFPEDAELVLSANRSGWPLATVFEGAAIELEGFAYPPTAQTIAGYENGLRLYYNFGEGPCGDNFQEFGSGNNSIDDPDNTTMTITNVQSKSNSYVLTGTFSGRVSSPYDFDDYLTLTNGKFRVTIPKL
jgi:hypothetical protein